MIRLIKMHTTKQYLYTNYFTLRTMQQNTNTYGHESRERRPYGYGRQPYSQSSFQRSNTIDSRPIDKPVVENNFPSLGSFPALGKAAAAKVHPEKSVSAPLGSTGRFNGLEEVIDVGSAHKPAFSYSSMASKAVDAPMKKIIEEKKVIVKSNKIDTKGKKVYMTQQQYLYDGHKYNADDVVIVDDNGQELYFSDDDNDCNDSDNDDNNDNDDYNEAW